MSADFPVLKKVELNIKEDARGFNRVYTNKTRAQRG